MCVGGGGGISDNLVTSFKFLCIDRLTNLLQCNVGKEPGRQDGQIDAA